VSNNEYVLYDDGSCETTDAEAKDSNEEGKQSAEDDLPHRDRGRSNIEPPEDRATLSDRLRLAKEAPASSLYRRELASVCFNTKHRPAADGVRGSEVCVPMPPHDIRLSADSKTGRVPPSLLHQFKKIQAARRQNDLLAEKCIVLHEKTSRCAAVFHMCFVSYSLFLSFSLFLYLFLSLFVSLFFHSFSFSQFTSFSHFLLLFLILS
jgi:hypothetical protein